MKISTDIFIYSFISTLIVSLISFVGAIALTTLAIKKDKFNNFLIYFVSFSAGALFADVFFHLFPEITEETGFTLIMSFATLFGILFSFFIEKIICWRHCHLPITKNHTHRFAYMNLIGDFLHNFIDGLTIGVSYLISIPAGLATSLAVIFHEIPQEIGDLGVLIYGGFTKKKALLLNFLTALSAFFGLFLSFYLFSKIDHIKPILTSFAAGNFIYIAGSDLIPELHKETDIKKSINQLLAFVGGIIVIYGLTFVE